MQQLKQDRGLIRYPDRGARNEPVDPLTDKEKKQLEENVWEKCRNGYVRRLIKSGLLADYDEIEDLTGEAYIFFHNIMSKFDKSKCGKIQEYDEEGSDKGKTLEFYFKNYFYGRINFVACEVRDQKKKRGIGPRSGQGTVMEVSFDAKHTGDFSEYEYEHEVTGEIFSALNKKSDDFKRFFYESYRVEFKQSELRERWGNKYNKLKNELTKFKKQLQKNHYATFVKETGRERKRTKSNT